MTDLLTAAIVHVLVGLLGAVLLLEFFVRWKKNRELEPGILFLLMVAVVVGVAGGVCYLVVSSLVWAGSSCFTLAVTAGLAFFFKRRHRDILLASEGRATCFKTHVMKHRRHAVEGRLQLGYSLALFFAGTSAVLGAFVGQPISRLGTALAKQVERPPEPPAGEHAQGAVTVADLIAQGDALDPELEAELEPEPPAGKPEKVAELATEMETAATPEPEPQTEPEPEGEPEPPAPANPDGGMAARTPVIARPNNVNPAMRRPKNVPKNVFATHIRLVLQKNCFSCHGSSKQKGDLRLDTSEGIRKGGGSGPIVVAGDPEKSTLYYMTVLPPDDPDIMPAKGKPLTKRETELLRKWILFGADLGDGKHIADASGGGAGFAVDQLAKDVALPAAALVEKLKGEGVLVDAVSANQALLALDFSHLNDKNNIDLSQLTSIAANIHALDLTGTGIADDDLAALKGMPNLVRLELNKTGIGDAGLQHVASLANLQTLNLYGTQVTDAGLKNLTGLKKLKKLYLWQSKATADGAKSLGSNIPGLNVVL
jgi:hypothetical protein